MATSEQYETVLNQLKAQADPEAVAGMARFGINPESTYGISIPNLRQMAKQIGQDHTLAEQLWSSGIHEARILACMPVSLHRLDLILPWADPPTPGTQCALPI